MDDFTALPWAVWFAVLAILVTSTSNTTVLAAVTLGCWLTMRVLGGPRRAVSRVVAGVSLVLAAIWAVLGIGIQRNSLGGAVVWLLPSWSAESSGEFGGAVTAGQLHFALARGWQALAIVGLIGLLAQAVPAGGWMRLTGVVWGRAARLWDPMLCLGQAYVDRRVDQVRARRAGFTGPGILTSLADVVERARLLAGDWHARPARPRSPLRGVVGLLVVIVLGLWWATSAIDLEPVLRLSGLERTFVALAALAVVGLVLHRGGLPRPTSYDAIPLVSAATVAGAWWARELTGDATALTVDFAQLPALPLVLLLSLAALPVLALAAGGCR